MAVDTAVLLHLIDPLVAIRPDASGRVPERCKERLDHFIEQLSKEGGRMIVPTPVLAEVLVKAAQAGEDWLNAFKGKRAVRISDFDERAAVECAAMARERAHRTRRSSRSKVKFDEQIVAISVIECADVILSDDDDIRDLAPEGVLVKGIGELELPPEDPQARLFDDKPGG